MRPSELPRGLRQNQAYVYEEDGISSISQFLMSALNWSVEDAQPRRERLDLANLDYLSVLFMDVKGTTRLYEEHGSEYGERIVAKTMRDWSKITTQYFGKVVKHRGDEMMCVFSTADDCLSAANEIREEIAIGLRGESIPIEVKMGLSSGKVDWSDERDDLLGEAVFLAARMMALSDGSQIVISHKAFQDLSQDLKELCRWQGETPVKWSSDPLPYYLFAKHSVNSPAES